MERIICYKCKINKPVTEFRQYSLKMKECITCKRERDREYSRTHKELRNKNRDAWKARHPKIDRAYKINSDRKRRKRIPPWFPLVKDHVNFIYEFCPEGHQVDHIWPLLGKTFSGLHVPWNMQYLPAEENLRKGNKAPEI